MELHEKMKTLIYLLLLNFCFSTGILSELNQNALYYSFGYYPDKIDQINNVLDLEEFDAKLYHYIIGYVLKGKYEFSLNYYKNNSIDNYYNFPFEGPYREFMIAYYLKDLDKIPLDFKISLSTGQSKTNDFKNTTFSISLFNKINLDNYPIFPYLELKTVSYSEDYGDLIEDMNLNIGVYVKMVVEKPGNSILRDIIWFSPNINTNNFKHYYPGITFGLYHPLK